VMGFRVYISDVKRYCISLLNHFVSLKKIILMPNNGKSTVAAKRNTYKK
jgi:hypothetical protein